MDSRRKKAKQPKCVGIPSHSNHQAAMPSLVLAAPTSVSSKSGSLQRAPPVVSPPVLPEAATPNTERTRVLDKFADAVFSSSKGRWTVPGPLSRRCKATQSPRTNTRASTSISQHAHLPLVQPWAWRCRAADWPAGPRRVCCGVVIAGSSGVKARAGRVGYHWRRVSRRGRLQGLRGSGSLSAHALECSLPTPTARSYGSSLESTG